MSSTIIGSHSSAIHPPLSIEDERAITAVLVRYATGIDRRDWLLFATCFTDDVEADYGKFGRWRGRDEIVDHMKRGHAPIGPTLHRLTNLTIAGTTDGASASSYVDALLMHPTSGQPLRRAHGWYEDQLVRVGEQWQIQRRRFVSVLIEP